MARPYCSLTPGMIIAFLDEKTLYLTPEQEKDKSHFTDKEVRGQS